MEKIHENVHVFVLKFLMSFVEIFNFAGMCKLHGWMWWSYSNSKVHSVTCVSSSLLPYCN